MSIDGGNGTEGVAQGILVIQLKYEGHANYITSIKSLLSALFSSRHYEISSAYNFVCEMVSLDTCSPDN